MNRVQARPFAAFLLVWLFVGCEPDAPHPSSAEMVMVTTASIGELGGEVRLPELMTVVMAPDTLPRGSDVTLGSVDHAMEVVARDAGGSQVARTFVPMTVSLNPAGVAQGACCVLLRTLGGDQYVWRQQAVKHHGAERQVAVSSTHFGTYRVVSCAEQDLAGFVDYPLPSS